MIKILIVDDQNFTRQALQAILETETDFEVIGQAISGAEALSQMEEKEADIIIVDLEMPEMDGLTVTKIIRQRFPDTRVIILSSHDDEAKINQAVEAGARGYLLKNTSTQEIADTIRAVQRGYFQLGPGLFEKLLAHLIEEKETAAHSLVQLEEKIMASNEIQREELYQEIESQINSLKQDFRDGLENFQYQVSNQLQNGIEAASSKFNSSVPDVQEIEIQIDNRNLEQQRYINTLFAGSKQAIQKLETQLNQMRYFVAISVIVLVAVILLLLY